MSDPLIFTRSAFALILIFTHEPFARAASPGAVRAEFAFEESAPATVEFTWTAPPLELESGTDNDSTVSMAGLFPTGGNGKPAVLGTGQLLAVPSGYEPMLTTVSVTESLVEGVHLSRQQHQSYCASEIASSDALFPPTEGMFPDSLSSLTRLGRLQDVDLYRVSINPIQVSDSRRLMRVIRNLKVSVSFKRVDPTAPELAQMTSSIFRVIHAATVNGIILPRVVTHRVPERILVVVPDHLQDSLKEFVAWKEATGLAVDILPVAAIRKSAPSVKAAIQERYNSSQRPTFVLLVGSVRSLPGFSIKMGTRSMVTDFPFGLLSGDDPVPDVLLGRVELDSNGDIQAKMREWIAFERDVGSADAWLANEIQVPWSQNMETSLTKFASEVAVFCEGGMGLAKGVSTVGSFRIQGTVDRHFIEAGARALSLQRKYRPTGIFGGAMLVATLDLLRQGGHTKETIENLSGFNLLADPSMHFRTDLPREAWLIVKSNKGQRVLKASVEDMQGSGIAGVLVSVQDTGGAFIGVGRTDDSGAVEVDLKRPRSTISLTLTGFNLKALKTQVELR